MSEGKLRLLLVSIVPPHNDCGVRIGTGIWSNGIRLNYTSPATQTLLTTFWCIQACGSRISSID